MRFERHEWPAAPRIEARVARPFDESRTVVVETPFEDPAGLYESLVHSQAVVALNTTAELEAGIVGRPVFTIRPEAADDGDHQATLHFHYLTREHGGFVSAAPDLGEHVRQLERALTAGEDLAEIRSFIASFLRPHGLDRAVLPLLVNALEASAATVSARAEGPAPDPSFDQPSGRSEGPRLVPLGESASTMMVHATPEALSRLTDDGAVRLDAGTMKWLNRRVHTGEVLYDINANFGPYALIAAIRRGARVVAFEPGHRAYGALCDNLLLNQCQGAVIPVPLPLAGQDGLADVRSRRDSVERNQQAYCWSRLDTIVDRYGLPPPSHIRLSASASPFDVLDGAEGTVAGAALRTIWLEVLIDQQTQMVERLLVHGFTLQKRRERRKTVGLLFARGA
jgi:FkbM family methyltransferase